jgi:hypothetical protein
MGIRDYLADWVDPYDTQTGLKRGDVVLTSEDCNGFGFLIPKGSEVVIDCVPEARHGADEYGLSSVNYTDPETGEVHDGLEWALSAETAEHHFGRDVAGVHRPGEEPARINHGTWTVHECDGPRAVAWLLVRKGTDPEGKEVPWSLFLDTKGERRTPIVFCPFCGEKLISP